MPEQTELLSAIYLRHPLGHLFLPSRRFLLETMNVSRDFLPLLFADLRELLFKLKHGCGIHSEVYRGWNCVY